MNKEEIIEKLNKALKTLESVDIMSWQRRNINQVKIHKAYLIIDMLKKSLKGESEDV